VMNEVGEQCSENGNLRVHRNLSADDLRYRRGSQSYQRLRSKEGHSATGSSQTCDS